MTQLIIINIGIIIEYNLILTSRIPTLTSSSEELLNNKEIIIFSSCVLIYTVGYLSWTWLIFIMNMIKITNRGVDYATQLTQLTQRQHRVYWIAHPGGRFMPHKPTVCETYLGLLFITPKHSNLSTSSWIIIRNPREQGGPVGASVRWRTEAALPPHPHIHHVDVNMWGWTQPLVGHGRAEARGMKPHTYVWGFNMMLCLISLLLITGLWVIWDINLFSVIILLILLQLVILYKTVLILTHKLVESTKGKEVSSVVILILNLTLLYIFSIYSIWLIENILIGIDINIWMGDNVFTVLFVVIIIWLIHIYIYLILYEKLDNWNKLRNKRL